MSKPSPLLTIFALMLIILSPIVLISKLVDVPSAEPLVTDGITTKAKIESKKDSTAKNSEGISVSFIYVSYRITADAPVDTVQHDSLYLDSVAAIRRMMIAKNFKIDIPGVKFAEIPVEKKVFDQLHEGDSLKIIYSASDAQQVKLPDDNPEKNGAGKPKSIDKTKSTWITACIIAFMIGIWIIIMNKRRRAQGQESDPLSSMNYYSSIKKDEGPNTGGRP